MSVWLPLGPTFGAARSTNGAVRFLGVLPDAKRSPNRFSVCYTGRFYAQRLAAGRPRTAAEVGVRWPNFVGVMKRPGYGSWLIFTPSGGPEAKSSV